MRVLLRETIETDLPILFANQADPESSAMAAFPSRDWESFLVHQAKIEADETVLTRTIVADGEVAGSIGSWRAEGERCVGYWIGRAFWGRGIATAALDAFVALDRARPLTAYVAAHNRGSLRVLQKCGFVVVRQQRAADGVDEFVTTLD